MLKRRKSVRAFLTTCLTLATVSVLFSQTPRLDDLRQQNEGKQIRPRTDLKSALGKKRATDRDALRNNQPLGFDLTQQALEAAIDPDTYIVGPGDRFLISIWSSLANTFTTMVTPEGKLVIPTIGPLAVDGKTLSQVQAIVAAEGAKKYKNTEVTADLVQVRSFRVHITGQVENPGSYNVFAGYRISDLVRRAGNITPWGFEREIELRHADNTTEVVDYMDYLLFGNLKQNPALRGGDVLFVPAIDLKEKTVKIEGNVAESGIYQITRQETLSDFLLRTRALNRRSDLEHAFLKRRKEGTSGGTETIALFPYLSKTSNGFSELELMTGDEIMVPLRQEDVYVIGSVQSPGAYPYIPNLRVRDYVGFAGSNFQAGNLDKTVLIKNDNSSEQRGKDLIVKAGDTIFVPRKSDVGLRDVVLTIGQLSTLLLALNAIGTFN